MRNSIFTGKGAQNNEIILKILYEKGCLTAWGIAKELALLYPKKSKDVYHKAQEIQSLLIRKNGRLEDLVNKQFLKNVNKGYSLTFNKGYCSALVLFDEDKIPAPAIDFFNDIENLVPELRDFAQLLSNLNSAQSNESLKEVRSVTINLLEKGLNFEKITNQEFGMFFNDQFEQYNLNLLKSGKKSPAHAEWTPELEEAAYKFIVKMNDLLQAQAKELEKLSLNYKQKLNQNTAPSVDNVEP